MFPQQWPGCWPIRGQYAGLWPMRGRDEGRGGHMSQHSDGTTRRSWQAPVSHPETQRRASRKICKQETNPGTENDIDIAVVPNFMYVFSPKTEEEINLCSIMYHVPLRSSFWCFLVNDHQGRAAYMLILSESSWSVLSESELKRWRMAALDKLGGPDGRTEIKTFWAPVGAKKYECTLPLQVVSEVGQFSFVYSDTLWLWLGNRLHLSKHSQLTPDITLRVTWLTLSLAACCPVSIDLCKNVWEVLKSPET